MNVHGSIVAAIESFNRWEHPWEFYSSVISLVGTDAREELERIWEVAADSAAWSMCRDLGHGCVLADTRLSEAFPWLSPSARRRLVNAAAYQWR